MKLPHATDKQLEADYHYRRFFHQSIAHLFGEQMKTSDELCQQMWGSMANVSWYHNQHIVDHSFRGAGRLIATIRGEGDYLDWYMSAPSGQVTQQISEKMATLGWSHCPAVSLEEEHNPQLDYDSAQR